MSVRQALIILNIVAVGVIVIVIAVRVLSLRRNPEPSPPPNKTPFLDDEDLEGRRLERVLGWGLLWTLVIAVSLGVYFVIEPDRQVAADRELFEERSVERGATLFANEQSPAFDSAASLGAPTATASTARAGRPPRRSTPRTRAAIPRPRSPRRRPSSAARFR